MSEGSKTNHLILNQKNSFDLVKFVTSDTQSQLADSLLKIKLDKEHMEVVGREFVNSYVDVLPIHPNLRTVEKYNPSYV